ncbi:MAG: DUF434 domain-containing protein [Candidatus Hydrogenedentes bacterium]|nr:DUF434 domain-containing protein [Candidatus Hydrogenedentota bacterium]
MPFRQQHRGRHPEDTELFAPGRVPVLQGAARDLSWLYTRGYAANSALKLVGDRYQLAARERMALQRAACSEGSRVDRAAHRVALESLSGAGVALDGYNLLITVESMLSGGVLIRARDGCLRDLASLHGSYRRVEETEPALMLIGETLARLKAGHVRWYLDAPVSNSGRLARCCAAWRRGRRGHGKWKWRTVLIACCGRRRKS